MTTYKEISKKEKDLTKERNDRCEPIAQELIKIIAASDLPYVPGNDRNAFVKAYDPIVKKVLELLKDKDIPLDEWNYIMQIALVPLQQIQVYVAESINMNMKAVMSSYWKKDEGEVTLQDVENKLKENIA